MGQSLVTQRRFSDPSAMQQTAVTATGRYGRTRVPEQMLPGRELGLTLALQDHARSVDRRDCTRR
jgi:hypothetical protein